MERQKREIERTQRLKMHMTSATCLQSINPDTFCDPQPTVREERERERKRNTSAITFGLRSLLKMLVHDQSIHPYMGYAQWIDRQLA